MDKITKDSPKRLIVLDCIDALAQKLFGDKYDYRMAVSLNHDPLEKLNKLEKPVWYSILGDESSELTNYGGTIENEVLINIEVVASVVSDHLVYAMSYLEDIETIKRELIGCELEHKDHWVKGNVQNEDYPVSSATHDIEQAFGGLVLRIIFSMTFKIDDDD